MEDIMNQRIEEDRRAQAELDERIRQRRAELAEKQEIRREFRRYKRHEGAKRTLVKKEFAFNIGDPVILRDTNGRTVKFKVSKVKGDTITLKQVAVPSIKYGEGQ